MLGPTGKLLLIGPVTLCVQRNRWKRRRAGQEELDIVSHRRDQPIGTAGRSRA